MQWKCSRRRVGTVTALALALSVGIGFAAAGAAQVKPLATGLAGPLQLDVSRRGVLVGQSFSGTLSVVDRDGSVEDLTEPGQGVDGVAWGPKGSALFTHTDFDAADDKGVAEAELRVRRRDGSIRTIADLRAHEEAKNPDAGNSYGFQDVDAACMAQLPPDAGVTPYTGLLDSHPYALATFGSITLVADAGGNDILAVDRRGHVHTIAVLPPQPTVVTAEAAAANELPECVVGKTFNFEPVPTDVEIGKGGLYVTTLPGGPEDPSLGARGSVYKINPWSGRACRVATGFLGATNLAISPEGKIYVAELFGNQISRVSRGGPVPVATIPNPAAVEWYDGRLFVGADVFGSGQIVTIRTRTEHDRQHRSWHDAR